ncbi:MAG: tetratricopeptide repeat protein, partial [Chloroflexia bacterium]
HEMADHNPDDLSTQMALASAYAQSGEYDAALRTYRRALKKRTMSPAMLEVIADELSDIEAEAAHLPRFHQVLGDLYMKQGRYKDAIDEYNKIG